MACLRTLGIQDAVPALALSSAEGWNQTEKDWLFLIQNPENICLAYEIDGRLAGTATAIKFGNELAWIGMVLVHELHRGKGISKILLTRLLDDLKSCRCIKLDATPAGQPVYEKLGFCEEYQVHRLIRHPQSYVRSEHNTWQLPEKINVAFIEEIIDYDQKNYGVDRSQLITYLIREYPESAWMIKDKGKVAGFVLGRNGSRFHHLGPMTADSVEISKALFSHILPNFNGQPLVADVSGNQPEMLEWLKTAGFILSRSFMRMYFEVNCIVEVPEKQFLISGPEFG